MQHDAGEPKDASRAQLVSSQIWTLLRPTWKRLVATDLMYKLLALILLTPLFVALFRLLLWASGNQILSDLDIAYFFAGPAGWFCAITIGGVWLAILTFEQASLLWILSQSGRPEKVHMLDALRFSTAHATGIYRVTLRIMAWTGMVLAPFLLLALGVYFWLLTEFDINYYLTERPSEFRVAVAIGAVLVVLLIGVLLRMYSGWLIALPLVLFEDVPPPKALSASSRLVAGNRGRIFYTLVLLVVFLFLANLLCTIGIGLVGQLLLPSEVGSLAILAARIGILLTASFLASLAVQLLSSIGLAGVLMQSYQSLSPQARQAMEHTQEVEGRGGRLLPNLSGPQLALAVGVLALVVAATGYQFISGVRLEDEVAIMAHRGASRDAPENTLAAFRQAIADGADWIEIDVQETADGQVIVSHDQDLMKLAGNPTKIWQANLQELANIDIGSRFAPEFSNERVATLRQVLELCKDQVGVNIELKYYGHDQQLEQRVIELVEEADMAEQVMLMSLKREGVSKAKTLRPNWKYGLLLSVYVGKLKDIETDFLAINAEFASRRFIKRAHRAGKDVYVWTVDDPATMSMLINRGVDGILTNRPAVARDVLRQRAELSSSERLLAEISVWLRS